MTTLHLKSFDTSPRFSRKLSLSTYTVYCIRLRYGQETAQETGFVSDPSGLSSTIKHTATSGPPPSDIESCSCSPVAIPHTHTHTCNARVRSAKPSHTSTGPPSHDVLKPTQVAISARSATGVRDSPYCCSLIAGVDGPGPRTATAGTGAVATSWPHTDHRAQSQAHTQVSRITLSDTSGSGSQHTPTRVVAAASTLSGAGGFSLAAIEASRYVHLQPCTTNEPSLRLRLSGRVSSLAYP